MLDLFAAPPADPHQRGWVRLPSTWLHDADRVVPGWVCCQCAGVSVSEFTFELNHSCCTNARGCKATDLLRTQRACGNAREPLRQFDALWTERPP